MRSVCKVGIVRRDGRHRGISDFEVEDGEGTSWSFLTARKEGNAGSCSKACMAERVILSSVRERREGTESAIETASLSLLVRDP